MAAIGPVKTSLLKVLARRGPSDFKTHVAFSIRWSRISESTIRKVSYCANKKGLLAGSLKVVEQRRYKITFPKPPEHTDDEQLKKNKVNVTEINKSAEEEPNQKASERQPIDWLEQYLAKDKQLLQKDKQLLEKDQDLSKFLLSFKETNEKLQQALREVAEASAAKTELKFANDEILRLHSMLSARGVIEYFDKKSPMPMSKRGLLRNKRYEYICETSSVFRQQLKLFFGQMPNSVTIGDLAEKIFSNASADVHSFDKSKGVQISAINYSQDEVKMLQSVCASLPCNFSIE